jgi:hypothetical protein
MIRLSLPSMPSEFPESNDAPVTRHYWESRSGSVTPSPSSEGGMCIKIQTAFGPAEFLSATPPPKVSRWKKHICEGYSWRFRRSVKFPPQLYCKHGRHF